MDTVKVTIALSAYNVAEFVRASLDCIVNQTLRELEIICIDDASTDGTWEILQEYAAKDSRIRLFRQEKNQGLSVSRNLAIQEAKGEYLLMLDGDDLFAPDMVEKAYNKAKETEADMVLWDYAVFYEEKELERKIGEPSTLNKLSVHDKVALLRRPAFMWVRLLRLSKVRELGVQFTPGLTKQDIPIHWRLVTYLDRISLLPERLSYYRQSPGNTTSRKGRSVFSLAYVMDITKQQLIEDGFYDTYKNEFLRSRLNLLQGMYDHIKPELKNEALALVKERLGEDEIANIRNPQNELTSRTRNFYGMLNGSLVATLKYRGFNLIRSIYRKVKLDA